MPVFSGAKGARGGRERLAENLSWGDRRWESGPSTGWSSKLHGLTRLTCIHASWSHQTYLQNPSSNVKLLRMLRWQPQSIKLQAWGSLLSIGPCVTAGVACLSRKPVLLLAPVNSASRTSCCLTFVFIRPPTNLLCLSQTLLGYGQNAWRLPLLPPSAAPWLFLALPKGLPWGAAVCNSLFPLAQPHRGCCWEPGPKERRTFSLLVCLQLLLLILVKRSPRVKNDYLCTLLITLPFSRKMTVTFPFWQQQSPPSDLAGSDLQV